MKKCTKCKLDKEDSEYYNESYKYCKECHSERVKQNRKEKKEHYNKYKSTYYSTNKDKAKKWIDKSRDTFEDRHGISYKEYHKAKVKKRREAMSERDLAMEKARSRIYVLRNSDRLRKYKKDYYQKNKAQLRAKALENYYKRKNKE